MKILYDGLPSNCVVKFHKHSRSITVRPWAYFQWQQRDRTSRRCVAIHCNSYILDCNHSTLTWATRWMGSSRISSNLSREKLHLATFGENHIWSCCSRFATIHLHHRGQTTYYNNSRTMQCNWNAWLNWTLLRIMYAYLFSFTVFQLFSVLICAVN